MTFVIAGQLLVEDGPRRMKVSPGTVVLREGRIESVSAEMHPSPDFGGPGYLISPGFVDTHVHLPQFDSIGVDGLELLDWLERVIFPAEARWADAEYAGAMAGRVAKELLSFGTTSVAAYATPHHEGARAAMEALAAAGMGGYVGQVLMDRLAPAELLVSAREALAGAAEHKAVGRISPAVTPRFAVTCSEEMLRGAGELAKKTGWLVQTHLAETVRECEVVSELFGGDSYVGVYEKARLLGPKTVLGHGIWLGDEDHTRLRQTGAVIAHCPTANRFLEAGEMDRARTLAAGVRVALGSDVAGGPDRSMVRVARGMIETGKQVRKTKEPGAARCTASEAWWQITAGNAEAIGLMGTGRLEAGMLADVVVMKPVSTWLGSVDPLAAVLWGWDDRWVRTVFAEGRLGWTE